MTGYHIIQDEVFMDRRLDWPALLLFTALLFGALVRFLPAILNGFPLNDGGMFHAMTQDLQSPIGLQALARSIRSRRW